MERRIIKGNAAMAEALNIHKNTLCKWVSRGLLDGGIVARVGHTIIYDYDLVLDSLTSYTKRNASRRPAPKQK